MHAAVTFRLHGKCTVCACMLQLILKHCFTLQGFGGNALEALQTCAQNISDHNKGGDSLSSHQQLFLFFNMHKYSLGVYEC